MDKTSYYIWRYGVIQILYIIVVSIIIQMFPFRTEIEFWVENWYNFWYRFGFILLASLGTFISASFLKKQSKQKIMKNEKQIGSQIIKTLIKALILSGSVVATLTILFTSTSTIIDLQHGYLMINMYYVLIYFITYLVTVIVVNVLTTI